MIDMHCHILYGVDDGCQTLDDSLRMIRKAISVGVTDMILTSHYAPMRGYVKTPLEIEERFHELKREVEKANLSIRLYLGREIDRIDHIEALLKEKKIRTMNHTQYVLVDFGMEKCDIDEYCYELIINGYTPIIAHPERYNYISDFKDYHTWVKTGALLQVNASSLFHTKSKKTKKNALYMMKHNLVSFIGSDAHSNEASYDYLKKALKKYSSIDNKLLLGKEV